MRIAPTNTISPPVDPQQAQHTKAAQKVAREFESIFTSYMLQSMRKTIADDPLVPSSTGEKIYTDMLDQEYAKLLSKNGNLGLADMILKQINKEDGGTKGLDALKELRYQPWMSDNRFIPSSSIRQSTVGNLHKNVSRWNDLIQEASTQLNLDRNLIAAVMAQESAGNPMAKSTAGAKGLMQIMDSTGQDLGLVNAFDPRENVFSGAKYLKQMLTRFNGNESLALAAYNAGPGAVERASGIPEYPETQNYVSRVLELRAKFSQLQTQDLADQYGTAQ